MIHWKYFYGTLGLLCMAAFMVWFVACIWHEAKSDAEHKPVVYFVAYAFNHTNMVSGHGRVFITRSAGITTQEDIEGMEKLIHDLPENANKGSKIAILFFTRLEAK